MGTLQLSMAEVTGLAPLIAYSNRVGNNFSSSDAVNNIDELTEALNQKGDKPLAIVANTIKGKGIKEMEDNMFAWHHRAPTDEEYKSFIEELI